MSGTRFILVFSLVKTDGVNQGARSPYYGIFKKYYFKVPEKK
jgi:hypothetical protein